MVVQSKSGAVFRFYRNQANSLACLSGPQRTTRQKTAAMATYSWGTSIHSSASSSYINVPSFRAFSAGVSRNGSSRKSMIQPIVTAPPLGCLSTSAIAHRSHIAPSTQPALRHRHDERSPFLRDHILTNACTSVPRHRPSRHGLLDEHPHSRLLPGLVSRPIRPKLLSVRGVSSTLQYNLEARHPAVSSPSSTISTLDQLRCAPRVPRRAPSRRETRKACSPRSQADLSRFWSARTTVTCPVRSDSAENWNAKDRRVATKNALNECRASGFARASGGVKQADSARDGQQAESPPRENTSQPQNAAEVS